MGDPVFTTVVGVGVALTKMFLRACDAAFAADLVGDGQELLGTLLRASRRTDESRGQIERRISQTLANRIQTMQERCGSQSVDPGLLSGACTEVEIILDEITNDDGLLLSAVRSPESFPEKLRDYAAGRRMNVESAAEPYFDELIEAVATQYAAFAPWSPRFQIEAFKSILSGIDEIQENSRRSLDAHAVTHDKLDTLSSKLAEVAHHENKPSRVFFGSRPNVATGSNFVERVEQHQLNDLIADPTQRRTVLVGMRGCGKTQLASTLAQQCEDAHWILVAWVNAGSRDSITSDLVELAKELKIDTSDQPTQEQVIARCLNYLRTSEASDRLVVFDNVEDINDLRGLVPTGDGLRVLATTTNRTGWEHQGWKSIQVGVFDRKSSISYLLTVTDSADREAASTLSDRLGDLPLALAQAAATARNGNLSLARYLKRLDCYRSERVIRPVPGDYYTDDVATALCMAIEDALDNLEDGTKQAARYILGALALLAESGVPTRWLDPMSEEHDEQELQDHDRGVDEDAHDALTELLHKSIVQQSADKTTTMLHRLQAQAFRESWDENEATEAYESAAILLRKVDVDRFPRNATDSRRQEVNYLIEQLHIAGAQKYSLELFADQRVRDRLVSTLVRATDLGLANKALYLRDVVEYIHNLLGPERIECLKFHNGIAHAYEDAGYLTEAITMYEQLITDSKRLLGNSSETTSTLRNNLAGTYVAVGRLNEGITIYEEVVSNRTAILGAEHPSTLSSLNNLAHAYQQIGELDKAIKLLENLTSVRRRTLGPDHPDTLAAYHNLAFAYQDLGQLDTAMKLYEQIVSDSRRIQGAKHPNTLRSRHNLAYIYEQQGHFEKAADLYRHVLSDRITTLGENHPETISTRNNLAGCLLQSGQIEEALDLYEQVLLDRTRILGADHPDTLTTRNNIAYAYQKAGLLDQAITIYERVLTDRTRILGADHPDTLTTRNNIAYAYQKAGLLDQAITIYERVLTDRTRILGADHPHTLASRNNLAYAYSLIGRMNEAIPLFEQTLHDSIRVLGEAHPFTATVWRGLGFSDRLF